MKTTARLREPLTRPARLVTRGPGDPLLARMVEEARFDAVHVTGSGRQRVAEPARRGLRGRKQLPALARRL
jgi:2-methylisocitrate lyase-like PEP mutase family enzyme